MNILKLLGIFQAPKWPEQILKVGDLFKRFPHIGESIFNNLDNQSLINCKEASQELSEFLEKERFFWLRILRNYSKHYDTFQDFWKMAVNRTSIQIVKHLAVATKTCYPNQIIYQISYDSSLTKIMWSPIHVPAVFGNLQLIEHVLQKICEKIPSGSVMIIPPGNHMSSEIKVLITRYSMDKITVRPYNGLVGDEQSALLYLAAKKGNFGFCRLMVDNDADGQSMYRSPAYDKNNFIMAVANSHLEIAKLLLTEKVEEKIIPRILEERPFMWKP
jgi:hypothetical protein